MSAERGSNFSLEKETKEAWEKIVVPIFNALKHIIDSAWKQLTGK